MKYVTEPKSVIEEKKITWTTIQKNEQVTLLASINFQKPTPSSDLLFTNSVEYSIGSSSDRITFDFQIPFNFVEFIRPTPMSTSDYFALWKNSKVEQTFTITSTLRNASLFAEKMTKLFHVALVDLNTACMICCEDYDWIHV